MTLEFREVTEDNFEEFVRLEVSPDQKNNFYFKRTDPNLWSLAQMHVYKGSRIRAIYADDIMVGGMFYAPSLAPEHPERAWLTRFMIDQRHQGKGHGRKAMLMLFDRVKAENPKATRLGLSYEPENTLAAALYKSLGFEETGKVVNGQVVVRKNL
ncbi:MAG: GNAT family N-acetyltransferase [Thermoplasmata archaeon]